MERKRLYVSFLDFDKAFDSEDCSALWRIMRSFSIPEKIVMKVIYSESECAVIDGSSVLDWFEIKCETGLLYVWVSFFLLAVDWVMIKTTKHGNTDIR